MHRPPTVALLGPTASGKTAAALALAQRWPIEIISVDSALVYRHMDIGTAKPTAEERARVPHHLIDIIDPENAWSAAQFVAAARPRIDDIRARGRVPLLVGGTMLYIDALKRGLHDLPGADASVRARLDDEARRMGWPALHARLAEVDPATAARLAPADAQRIQRALEIFELSGVPMSRLIESGIRTSPEVNLRIISLEPSQREVLHERIAQRLALMVQAGFFEEVDTLRRRPGLDRLAPSMRCVGYRQAWEYLEGRLDRDECLQRAIVATRQLAKRQLTWLRGWPEREVIDCLDENATAHIERTLVAEGGLR